MNDDTLQILLITVLKRFSTGGQWQPRSRPNQGVTVEDVEVPHIVNETDVLIEVKDPPSSDKIRQTV